MHELDFKAGVFVTLDEKNNLTPSFNHMGNDHYLSTECQLDMCIMLERGANTKKRGP